MNNLESLSIAERALFLYVMNEYESGTFETSFTLGSLDQTKEETLLAACMGDSEDWLGSIRGLVFDIHVKTGINSHSEESHRLRYWAMDAFNDLLFCHVREMD